MKICLLVFLVCFAQVGFANDFVDKVIQANPVNHLISSGTMVIKENFYGTTENSVEYQYKKKKVSTFRDDGYARIETYLTTGEIPLPSTPEEDISFADDAYVNGDSITWITPDSSYYQSIGETRATHVPNRPYPKGVAPSSTGVLTTRIVDLLKKANPKSSPVVLDLGRSNETAVLNVDSEGVLRELVYKRPGYERAHCFYGKVVIEGKVLPERIVTTKCFGKVFSVKESEYTYTPYTPEIEEVVKPDSIASKTFKYNTARNRLKQSKFSIPRPEKTSIFWQCVHADMPYSSFTLLCCTGPGSGVEECESAHQERWISHGHCFQSYLPYFCSATSQPIILYWDCDWTPELGDNLCGDYETPCWAGESLEAVWEVVCEYDIDPY